MGTQKITLGQRDIIPMPSYIDEVSPLSNSLILVQVDNEYVGYIIYNETLSVWKFCQQLNTNCRAGIQHRDLSDLVSLIRFFYNNPDFIYIPFNTNKIC